MKTILTEDINEITVLNWRPIIVTGILLLIMGSWIICSRTVLLIVNAGSKRS